MRSLVSCLSLSDQRPEDGASERAHGAFVEEATSIMFRFPGPTAFSASSPRRGEERREEGHTHSHRQRQLEKGGREGGRRRGREGSIAVLHCKLCAPHKGLVIVRPLLLSSPPSSVLPLFLPSPTLLQWDKEQLAITE